MKSLKMFLIASMLLLITAGLASAQNPAYVTPFITSVTYQNVSNSLANVTFYFYQEGSSTAIQVPTTLAANAGSSLYIGGLASIPANFSGSAVLSSDQPIVATLVQIPQSTTVKNRPLSNGFSSASSQVTIATVLKNRFNTSTKFSVQNADSGAIDITATFYNADDVNAAPVLVSFNNVPQGSAKSFDAGSIAGLPSPFNGSAIVTAVKTGTSTPANIVASALELSTNGNAATAFEGVSAGARTVYMPSALCQRFNATTFYAVTNTSQTTATSITVTYDNGKTDTAAIGAGKKASINTCTANDAGYTGSATITSDTTDIVVIGKASGGALLTAFLGEPVGSTKLALPYVRWTADATFNNGSRQRGFIAIQNVGNAMATNVVVKYLNKNGDVVGTHTIGSLASKAKTNSTAINATLSAGGNANDLLEFGYPEGNPGGGFGGSVIVESTGSAVVAVVRIASVTDAGQVAEDYNGIPVQ